ncbi:MAG: hypothetical protein COV75_05090 [Candidatus Omnitrophica bacterium CG11_big_fil_rev_8_21_14_0_20_63_9]|nr:MAG: hypothetical protein COV75_05090 [Candidatus Omnitrophica bacterium CG11_big_fil_rev_8_21_14_0_20_63_9]
MAKQVLFKSNVKHDGEDYSAGRVTVLDDGVADSLCELGCAELIAAPVKEPPAQPEAEAPPEPAPDPEPKEPPKKGKKSK